ncbi:MAG: TIGR04222 domain-containing membrane protein [Anaeromyxobacter sp.]
MLAGGRDRAFEAVVCRLEALGLIEVDAVARTLVRKRHLPPHQLTSVEHAVLGASQAASIPAVRLAVTPHLAAMEARLGALGLRPAGEAARRVPTLLLLAMALFGAGKILVGLSRGRPVGFLVVLVGVAAFIAVLLWQNAPSAACAATTRSPCSGTATRRWPPWAARRPRPRWPSAWGCSA